MSFQKVFVTGIVSEIRPFNEDRGLSFTVLSSNRFVNSEQEIVTIVTPYEVTLRNPVGQRMSETLEAGTTVGLIGEFVPNYPRITDGEACYDVETYNLSILSGDERNDLQAVVLGGNLGKDAEMRYTPEGAAVASGSIASNVKRGEDKKTYWFNWTAWRALAEVATRWFTKGKFMIFLGRLQVDQLTGRARVWETQEGDSRSSYEITIDAFGFGGGGGNGGNGGPDPVYQGQDSELEDIPF